MVSKQKLEAEMVSLQKQEEALIRQMHEVKGAQRMCSHLLGKIQREEDEARKAGEEHQAASAACVRG